MDVYEWRRWRSRRRPTLELLSAGLTRRVTLSHRTRDDVCCSSGGGGAATPPSAPADSSAPAGSMRCRTRPSTSASCLAASVRLHHRCRLAPCRAALERLVRRVTEEAYQRTRPLGGGGGHWARRPHATCRTRRTAPGFLAGFRSDRFFEPPGAASAGAGPSFAVDLCCAEQRRRGSRPPSCSALRLLRLRDAGMERRR